MNSITEPLIVQGEDRPWLQMPPGSGNEMKLLIADEVMKQVVYVFRVAPGHHSSRHRHLCHAAAYTISGAWSYDTGPCPAGSLAYEPVGSEHEFESVEGSESVVFLRSDDDRFLENIGPDGSVLDMNMAFFKSIAEATPEDVMERISRFRRPAPKA